MMPGDDRAIDRDRDGPHARGALAEPDDTLPDAARTAAATRGMRSVGGTSCLGSPICIIRHEYALACVTATLLY
jgi:hypothetical protein